MPPDPPPYPLLRRRYHWSRFRLFARRWADRAGFGPAPVARVAAGFVLAAAAHAVVFGALLLVGLPRVVVVPAVVLSFLVGLAVFLPALLLGTDAEVAAERDRLAAELPAARAAWEAYHDELRRRAEAERERRVVGLQPAPATDGVVEMIPEPGESVVVPLARELPEWLRGNGSFRLQVVGESFYQRELEWVCGGRTPQGENRVVDAVLVLADDPHDRNAVAVTIAGVPVGRLASVDAGAFRTRLRKEAVVGDEFPCRANIRGGWDDGRGDRGHYGVWLDVLLYTQPSG